MRKFGKTERANVLRCAQFCLAGFVWLMLAAAFAEVTPRHSLQVRIAARHTSVPLVFEKPGLTNAAAQFFSVTRLDFLVSNFALRQTNGSWLAQSNWQAYVSVGGNRSSFRVQNLSSGKYDRVRFRIGLQPALNHSDPAKYPADHPLNPNLNGLHWGWASGYVFFAVEGHWQTVSNTVSGYSYHLGNDAMLMTVELPVSLVLDGDGTLDLALNLDAFFKHAFSDENSSTHSRAGDKFAESLRANLEKSFSALATSVNEPHQLEIAAKSKSSVSNVAKTTPYHFTFSAQFPMPDLPRDNPLTEEGVELGRKLFSEKLLSKDSIQSCASCHHEENAFADPGKRFSVGVDGEKGKRNSMPIFNMAWKKTFFWDGRATSLREQVLVPVQDRLEMHETLENVSAKISRDPNYPDLFEKAFGDPQITSNRVALALEQFIFTLTSYDSKFDRAMDGKETLADDEKRGFELFVTEYDPRREQFGADCFHCHGGPLFTTHGFANNGLDLTFADFGRENATGKDFDRGKFAVPSLRNVELTSPYMHDGRFKTLEEVVEHYSGGVKQSATLDPNLAKHPVSGIALSDSDKKALIAFLKTLTDDSLKRKLPLAETP